MRPWTVGQSEALYGDTMRAKPLSKLDNARLKLSRLKLKYGKQEKQLHVDPPSSSTDLSSSETSLWLNTNYAKMLPKEPRQNFDVAGDSEAIRHDSESFESDSLKSVPSKELISEYLPKEKVIQSRNGSDSLKSIPSKDLISEYLPKKKVIHSRKESDSLKSIPSEELISEYLLKEKVIHSRNGSDSLKSIPSEELISEYLPKEKVIQSRNGSDSLKSIPSEELISEYLPKEKVIQSRNGSRRSDSSISDIHENIHSFSSLELKSRSQHEDVSLKPISHDLVVENMSPAVVEQDATESSISSITETLQSESVRETKLSQITPAVPEEHTTEGRVSSIAETLQSKSRVAEAKLSQITPAVLEKDTTERRVSSIAETLQSKSRVAEAKLSQIAPMASLQETSNSTSGTASEITLQSRDNSPERVSSVTLISPKKKPRLRSVKVQTERKRSRTVQVSFSDGTYEGRSWPSYPVLRASSLPRGLRTEDDPVGYLANDVEDAVQFLLHSQMALTLNLLQREQALYFNCSRSAARLERGYKRHTLSNTRQFIREEKRLRDELRRNAE